MSPAGNQSRHHSSEVRRQKMMEPPFRVKRNYPVLKEELRNDTCYNHLFVDIITGRVLGIILISQGNNGVFTTNYLSLRMAYFLSVFTIMSYFFYIAVGELLDLTQGHRVAGAYTLFTLLFLYPLPIIFVAEAKKMNDYFNLWMQFQIDFRKKTGRILEFQGRYLIIIISLIKFLYYVFLLYLGQSRFPNVKITSTIVACYNYWVGASLTSLWYILTYYLYKTAERVQELLKAVVKNNDTRTTISEIETIWLDLYRLSKMTGQTFCFTYCYFMLLLFLILIVTAYECIVNLSLPVTLEKAALAFLTITAALHPASIPFSSEIAVRKIGEDFFKLVIDLKIKEVHTPKRMQEIDELLQVISDNKPLIDLGGFVTLGNSLITSLMSTMVTYLIVLVQFKV